jgi:hypothetical protein
VEEYDESKVEKEDKGNQHALLEAKKEPST